MREDSILVFGFKDDDQKNDYKKESLKTNKQCHNINSHEKICLPDGRELYFINGIEVSREDYQEVEENTLDKINEVYLDNIKDMILRYCDLMDTVNDFLAW